MTVQLTPDLFRARLNQQMHVREFGTLALELTAVKETAYSTEQHPAFSLMLHGPAAPALEQRTYTFEFADGSTFDIFIVPVAGNAAGMQYQAVFN